MSHMEEVTGYRPPTCPWRVFYDPLVVQAVRIASLAQEHLGDAYLGPDPPAVLLEAVYYYTRARNATRAHDMEQERKQRTGK